MAKLTLGELFKRREAEIKAELAKQDAWEATPEGKAWREDQEAHHKRMAEADARFARDNPADMFAEGKAAALSGNKREAPDDLSDDDADRWLEGWDSEGPDDG